MKYNPFSSAPNVNEDNYLKIRIERLKDDKTLPDAFNRAIDNLVQIRRVLDVVSRIGRLPELGSRMYYLQAIQWLNKEVPLSTFVSVPQISDLSSIDETTANQFEQYVTNLQSNMRGEQLFSQVEVMTAVAKANSTQKIQDREDEILKDFESKADDLLSTYDASLLATQGTITGDIEQRVTDARGNLQQELTNARNQINSQLSSAVSSFQQAQSLDQWGQAYEADIAEYETKLFGQRFSKGFVDRNFKALKLKANRSNNRKDKFLRKAWLLIRLILRNIMSLTAILWSKFTSYRNQRNFWFWLLVIFVLGFTVMSFASATGHTKLLWFNLPAFGSVGDLSWYLKLTLYIPPVVLLGIAYSFAVKNYRIYSNMVDQYRHRRTVAKTSQGIILSLSGEDNKDVRTQMTSAAALALFELRNTGHLTKKESESMSFIDIFKVFGGK